MAKGRNGVSDQRSSIAVVGSLSVIATNLDLSQAVCSNPGSASYLSHVGQFIFSSLKWE